MALIDHRSLIRNRLFNLAVDVPAAGLQDGAGKSLADHVKYTLGSSWAAVPATQQTLSAVADTTEATAPPLPLSLSLNLTTSTAAAAAADGEADDDDDAAPVRQMRQRSGGAGLAGALATVSVTPPSAPQVCCCHAGERAIARSYRHLPISHLDCRFHMPILVCFLLARTSILRGGIDCTLGVNVASRAGLHDVPGWLKGVRLQSGATS